MNLCCVLCGHSSESAEIVGHKLRDDPSGRHKVVRCPGCGHVQLSPLQTLKEEAAYYGRDMQAKAIFHDQDYYDILKSKAQMDIDRRLAWVKRVRAPNDGSALLDVGSGHGFFVDATTKAGYRAIGLEVSRERFDLSRARMQGTFIIGEADDAFTTEHAGRYDIVTSFHVIEHLRDPAAYIRRMFRLLAPAGHLLIEVPNLADEMTWCIPEYAAHQWQIAHVSYFDAPHLEVMLRQAGAHDFRVEGVQRYGLRHLLRWTDHRAPDLAMPAPEGRLPLTDRLEAAYRAERVRAMTCDTLIATIRA